MNHVGAALLPHREARTSWDIDAAMQIAGLNSVLPIHATGATAMLQVLVPGHETDVAIADWDELFNAVKERLRLAVGESASAPPRYGAIDARQVQVAVGECIEALDHLHLSMANELGRCQHLELEVFDANAALAQMRAERVGTQAGDQRARHLALHDGLTSLPNRGHFVQRLDHALAAPQRRPMSVMLLNLVGFKAINDAHGRAVGDEMLRIVAGRLSRVVRAEDMVSRLGGDEFGCLLSGLEDRAQLEQLAVKFFDAVSAPCKVGVLQLAIRPSIVFASSPGDGETSATLLRNAGAAMHRAKRRSLRHAFCCDA